MKDATTRFIPALGYHWLTWVYDQVVALTTRERRVKTDLLTHANLKPGDAVLDLGCGSGTLALMAVQAVPGLRLTEVDGDPAMLAHARRKVERFGAAISFDHALALGLPYVDATFEVVLSSLFFHLDRAAKRAVLREALRVLKPNGALYVADWGRA